MPLLCTSLYSRAMVLSMNELQVGERLDHYRIESLVAQSGMACNLSSEGRAKRTDRSD